ncbi:hypothetical protein EV421DRAFT_1870678 [Armillaria borealis]|uniref:Secreted protein n=1 Tax=Armillaria borealis TaxID=47425 RepID=A0AA39IDQ7_9AGAR|nr:hypothetical protein EV421DRAFT_1883373 [Armillaria borealis]KAK0421770.1 hypothetical protein EV421DRAFT_1870678 [Armillaria borealis]
MEVACAQSRHVVTCKLNFALIFVSLVALLPLSPPSCSPIRTVSGTFGLIVWPHQHRTMSSISRIRHYAKV